MVQNSEVLYTHVYAYVILIGNLTFDKKKYFFCNTFSTAARRYSCAISASLTKTTFREIFNLRCYLEEMKVSVYSHITYYVMKVFAESSQPKEVTKDKS